MSIKLGVQTMFYIIYKITNTINNKIYIGKHQTVDIHDSYMGSGKYLRRAVEKYGIENFKKEILFQFDNEVDMNEKEAELVTEEFCMRSDTYNICVGGKGGFSYINKTRNHSFHNQKIADNRDYSLTDKSYITDEFIEKSRERTRRFWAEGKYKFIPNTTGYKFTEEQKQRLSRSQQGPKNSQYGTMWVTNGQENKKIKKDIDIIPDGWYKGRK